MSDESFNFGFGFYLRDWVRNDPYRSSTGVAGPLLLLPLLYARHSSAHGSQLGNFCCSSRRSPCTSSCRPQHLHSRCIILGGYVELWFIGVVILMVAWQWQWCLLLLLPLPPPLLLFFVVHAVFVATPIICIVHTPRQRFER